MMDARNVDRLLQRLIKIHGAGGPRYDIAPEVRAATRAAARPSIDPLKFNIDKSGLRVFLAEG
jgi:hypothetical protein